MGENFGARLERVLTAIELPFGWSVAAAQRGKDWVLRVGDPNGLDNMTGDPFPWQGRKWLLSEHMTDGEIVQTAFLATMTAIEHETREQFAYRGVSVFDPHYDIEKLVELRASPDALKERAPVDFIGLDAALDELRKPVDEVRE